MKGGKSQIDFMLSCLCWGEVVKGNFGLQLWNVLSLRDDSVSSENFKHKKCLHVR